MTWLEIITVVALILVIAASGYVVAQRPTFWVGLAMAVWKQAWPVIWLYVSRRNPPEIEAKMQECLRRGGKWDNFRKKCVENR